MILFDEKVKRNLRILDSQAIKEESFDLIIEEELFQLDFVENLMKLNN